MSHSVKLICGSETFSQGQEVVVKKKIENIVQTNLARVKVDGISNLHIYQVLNVFLLGLNQIIMEFIIIYLSIQEFYITMQLHGKSLILQLILQTQLIQLE